MGRKQVVKNSTETNERGRGTPEGNRLSERTKCRGSASNWLPLGEWSSGDFKAEKGPLLKDSISVLTVPPGGAGQESTKNSSYQSEIGVGGFSIWVHLVMGSRGVSLSGRVHYPKKSQSRRERQRKLSRGVNMCVEGALGLWATHMEAFLGSSLIFQCSLPASPSTVQPWGTRGEKEK